MSLKMFMVVSNAKVETIWMEDQGLDTSEVVSKQRDFWDLDEEEIKYLVQKLDEWNKDRKDG